jgi:hypothetical protein
MYRSITVLLGFALVVASMNAVASEILRYNPFEQPDLADGGRGAGKTKATASMELRGTVIDGQDSLANIDGEYYRLNHELSGYRVIRIENGSVTLSRSGNETVLTLHNDE